MVNQQPRNSGRGPEPEVSLAGNDEDRAWPVHIDVHLDDDKPPNPKFRIKSSLPSYKDKKGEEILKFENNHRPGFKIHFHLHDWTDSGYKFAASLKEAVWSKIGHECPDSEVNEVFSPSRVVDSGSIKVPMLVVYMENEQVNGAAIGPFQYSLGVVKPGGSPLRLDPGGDAGNGPRT